jgi:hypothetical protein
VESDGTYVGGKNKNRPVDKKVENSQGHSFKDKTPVLGLVSRGGELKALIVPNEQGEIIQPLVQQILNNLNTL